MRSSLVFAFGLCLVLTACTAAQKKAATDGVSHVQTLVTHGGELANDIANKTPPGSAIHEWAVIATGVAGSIIALAELAKGGIKILPTSKKSKKPVAVSQG